jgi:ABC-2 type transport system permease protein/lipopolysaccharide transport system permease protein
MNGSTVATAPRAEIFPPPRAPRGPSRWLALIDRDRRELVRFWPVVQNMVVQDLRVRYQRSLLGFFWTLLNPILMMATLTLVFAQLLDENWRDYCTYLFAGLVPWGLLAGILTDSAYCIIINESLIRKIYLPKLIFPLTRVLFHLIISVLTMAAMFVLLVPLGARVSWPMLLLPVVVLMFTVFAAGLGLVIATLNTFYRDCGHLVGVVLQAWYFATPILYKSSKFRDFPWILTLNPARPFIGMFQEIIWGGNLPDRITFLVAAAIMAASLGVGYAAFKSAEDKLVFRL